MTINYNTTGVDRKKLVAAIAEITGAPAKYLGAPSFAYRVDYFTIDKNGSVHFDDMADSEEIEGLIERLHSMGFEAEPVEGWDSAQPEVTSDEDAAQPEEAQISGEDAAHAGEDATQPSGYGLTVSLPADSFTVDGLNNLHSLIVAKGQLIRRALGIDILPVQVETDTVSFPWFEGRRLDADEVKAYTHLIAALCDMARNQKRITAKEKATDNEKYAFRCFLLRLGFIGAEYKTERKILLRNLSGNGAFKSGQRNTEALQPEPPDTTAQVEIHSDQELAEALADEMLIQQVNASFGEEVAS